MGVNAIHGKNAYLMLATASGGAATNVSAEQVDYNITLTDSYAETTSLPGAAGTVWETYVKGPIGWGGKISGNFDPTSTSLWDASLADAAMNFYLYPQASAMTRYYYGTAFVMLKPVIDGGVKKHVTNAADLKGTSVLSRN